MKTIIELKPSEYDNLKRDVKKVINRKENDEEKFYDITLVMREYGIHIDVEVD